jgi:hypothetical protein
MNYVNNYFECLSGGFFFREDGRIYRVFGTVGAFVVVGLLTEPLFQVPGYQTRRMLLDGAGLHIALPMGQNHQRNTSELIIDSPVCTCMVYCRFSHVTSPKYFLDDQL